MMGLVAADLHCHSSFAGGASQKSASSLGSREAVLKRVLNRFRQAEKSMPLKGIQLLGTGDCQFDPWLQLLMEFLEEVGTGVWEQKGGGNVQYVLQTELIFTAPIGKRRKQVHVLVLFPDPTRVKELQDLLSKWSVKHQTMARPFITCQSSDEVSDRIFAIQCLDSLIEIIPAHVMTPTGVFGSDVRVNLLEDFFGSSSEVIRVVETGLSADPELLAYIPQLETRALLSNSDAHSPQLHRIGREFSVLEVNGRVNYKNIINALRYRKIRFTAEFPPAEGRYFLTGHRKGRKDGKLHRAGGFCAFSPNFVPKNEKCPLCGKRLTIGVLQRIKEIHDHQVKQLALDDKSFKPSQEFLHLIPLIDIIGFVLGIKSPTSKKVLSLYEQVIQILGPEVELWRKSVDEIVSELARKQIPSELIEAISMVKSGNYGYYPPGHDGEYGQMVIGKNFDYWSIEIINFPCIAK